MKSKKPSKQAKQTLCNHGIAAGFASVVNAFVEDKQVTRDEGKGFGSSALKVSGKIFAMMTSQHKFVVKLPKERVDELVRANLGENFAPRPGRLMKEWLVVFPTNNLTLGKACGNPDAPPKSSRFKSWENVQLCGADRQQSTLKPWLSSESIGCASSCPWRDCCT